MVSGGQLVFMVPTIPKKAPRVNAKRTVVWLLPPPRFRFGVATVGGGGIQAGSGVQADEIHGIWSDLGFFARNWSF